MKAPDLLSQRLRTQLVAGAGLASPEDVVHQLCAVQSQDSPCAKWSLGQRMRNGTDRRVEAAFASGAPHVHARIRYRHRQLELDAALFARSHALLSRALEGGAQLTRAELAAELRRGDRSEPVTRGRRIPSRVS